MPSAAPQATSRRNISLTASVTEAEARYAAANPESRRFAELGLAFLPGGNTRTTLHFSPFPLVLAGGHEGWLTDADGHRYADFVNEYSAGLFGHSCLPLVSSVRAALEAGINLGGINRFEARLAGHIVERFPSIDKLRFCNSGTEANLLALGAARAFTGRSGVMVFDGAYHGSLFYFHHGASPINAPIETTMAPLNDWSETRRIIEHHAETLAAVIIEPMQGASGCIPAEPEFLRALRRICTERGIVLVFDEVMTSRLSTGGLQARLGITPDMTTLGKYIGGGITLAAFGGRSDIMDRFDPRVAGSYSHGGTFNNNVLAMAAGCTAFDELLTAEALDRMNGRGDDIRERLNAFAAGHGVPFQITGVGSLMGLHFCTGKVLCAQDVEPPAQARTAVEDLKTLLHLDLLARGYYISRRGYATLSLVTSDDQIEGFSQAIEEFLTVRSPLIEEALAAGDAVSGRSSD